MQKLNSFSSTICSCATTNKMDKKIGMGIIAPLTRLVSELVLLTLENFQINFVAD